MNESEVRTALLALGYDEETVSVWIRNQKAKNNLDRAKQILSEFDGVFIAKDEIEAEKLSPLGEAVKAFVQFVEERGLIEEGAEKEENEK